MVELFLFLHIFYTIYNYKYSVYDCFKKFFEESPIFYLIFTNVIRKSLLHLAICFVNQLRPFVLARCMYS